VLRSQVGRQTGIKFTPTLAFVPDVVPEQAGRIDELLAVARDADAGLAQVRQGARYAGDPDPYKHEHDHVDETDDATAVTEVDSASPAGQSSDS
jgi:ribosome-binding factor A